MASTQPAHDPALAHATAAPAAPAPAPNSAQLGTPSTQPTLPANLIASMSHEQIASVLKHIPDLFSKVSSPPHCVPIAPASRLCAAPHTPRPSRRDVSGTRYT